MLCNASLFPGGSPVTDSSSSSGVLAHVAGVSSCRHSGVPCVVGQGGQCVDMVLLLKFRNTLLQNGTYPSKQRKQFDQRVATSLIDGENQPADIRS